MTPERTTAAAARSSDASRLLRFALLLDAVITGTNGAAYLLASKPLRGLLGIPVPFLLSVGVFLLSYAAAIFWVGRRRVIPAGGAWFAIGMNLAWSMASVTFAALSGGSTTIGRAWTVAQAVVVLCFGVLQFVGWQRQRQRATVTGGVDG